MERKNTTTFQITITNMLTFKSSEQLIARVESTLDSFKASGLLDSGDFYRWTKEILSRLNIPAYNAVYSMQVVDNYKIAKPDDMSAIWSAWRYDEEGGTSTFVEKQIENRFTYFSTTESLCKTDECDVDCNSKMYEENGNIIINKLYLKGTSITKKYCNPTRIKIKNHKGNWDGHSEHEASVDTNYIHFNFKNGYVYLQYYAFEVDENGLPMIPDVVQIEDAIETYIIYKFFLKQYYNNTFDVSQRLQVSKDLADRAFSNAVSWVKLPAANDMIDAILRKRRKFANSRV